MNRFLLSILTIFVFTTAAIAGNTPTVEGPGDKTPIIKSFPNPVTSDLTVEVEQSTIVFTKVEVKIVNLLGQEMVKPLKEDLTGFSNSFKIDLRDIPNGFYFMEVTSTANDGTSHTYTKKITKN